MHIYGLKSRSKCALDYVSAALKLEAISTIHTSRHVAFDNEEGILFGNRGIQNLCLA